MFIAALAASLLAVWVLGHVYGHSLEAALASRYSRGQGGIIAGAEDIVRSGSNGAAVLMIHGGGDTPQTLGRLADELNGRGYSIAAPLLPGHGRSLAELSSHSADEWYDVVRNNYLALRERHGWVGVIGLSMGGALSARLAAECPDVPALVLLSPYLAMPMASDFVVRTSWLWGLFVPYVNTASDRSVLDPDARSKSLGYGVMSASALRALRTTARRGQAALSQVLVPTLIIQSRLDNRVSVADTTQALAALGSTDKAIEWVADAGHVITVDYGWQHVVRLTADWMDSHRPAEPRGR